MNAAELLSELERRGVALETAGDRLRYDAPQGALTPDLRRAMAEHKTELLGLLGRRIHAGSTNLVVVAELLIAGQMLGWPELPVAPHLTILAGEDRWLTFLECPPPGAIEAALALAKTRVEEAWLL